MGLFSSIFDMISDTADADHSAPINFCPMCGRNLKEK